VQEVHEKRMNKFGERKTVVDLVELGEASAGCRRSKAGRAEFNPNHVIRPFTILFEIKHFFFNSYFSLCFHGYYHYGC
jgi:hypothetical protein